MSTIQSENKIMAHLVTRHHNSIIGVIATNIINCNDHTKLIELRSKLQGELSGFIKSEKE